MTSHSRASVSLSVYSTPCPFAHSTERSADVVPIHHSTDGDQHVAGSLGGYRSLRGRDDLQAENLDAKSKAAVRIAVSHADLSALDVENVLPIAVQIAVDPRDLFTPAAAFAVGELHDLDRRPLDR